MAEGLEATDEVEFAGDADLVIASRDFERITHARTNAGYLEGIEVGKQQGLEEGFRDGFVRGLQCTAPWSVLRGRICAFQAYCSKLAKKQDHPSLHGKISHHLNELLGLTKDKEEKWTKHKLAEETKTYHYSVVDKRLQTLEKFHSDTTVLEDLLSMQQPCAELQELCTRLEELKIQILSH